MQGTLPKPRGFSEKEWVEISAATKQGYLRYVFGLWKWLTVPAALAVGLLIFNLIESTGEFGPRVFAGLVATPALVGLGCAAFFFGVVPRSLDWIGARRIVKGRP